MNIASAVRGPGGNSTSGSTPLTNGTNTTQNSRSCFFNECGKTVTALAIVLPGWYVDGTNESSLPNNYTATASIEYPAGTFTQVTWSSSTSATVTPGTNLISDYVTLTTPIPAGSQFWVRIYVSVTAGQKWTVSDNYHPLNTALGEKGEQGVGLSDKTLSGTIGTGSLVLRPCGILSNSTSGYPKVNMAICSDSIGMGVGDNNYDSHNNIGGFARAATGLCPVLVLGDLGTQVSNQIISGKYAKRLDLITKCGITHVFTDYGVNDITLQYPGLTGAILEANQVTFWNLISANGQQVIQSTLTPHTFSTDSWLTTASQSNYSAAFQGSTQVRGLSNANIRTTPSPLLTFVEVTNNLETAQDSNVWGVGAAFNSTHLRAIDSWTASGGTTTTVTSNSTNATNYYNGGVVIFTSGALNGVEKTISFNTGGTFTLGGSLSQAPSNGDTFTARPVSVRTTADGLHPVGILGSPIYGGAYIIADTVGAVIAGLL